MEVVITGAVKKLGKAEDVSATFSKQLIVVTVDENTQYSQDIPIEFTNNNISKLDSTEIGDKVEIKANLKGSEYQDKHYVSLIGWYYKHL